MYPLLEHVEATADANGRAVAQKGPQKYGTSWMVRMLSTTTNSTSESRLYVYRNFESQSTKVDSTYSGNNDISSGNEIAISSQEKLLFIWENATPGSICTCRFEGDLISSRR